MNRATPASSSGGRHRAILIGASVEWAGHDPGEAIELIVRIRRRLREHAGRTIAVLRAGAAIEPSLKSAWDEGRRYRRAGQLFLMRRMEEQNALAEGVDATRAADISGALTADEVADVLIDQCGWSYDEYESWLIATLRRLLLPPTTGLRRRSDRPARPTRG